MNILETIDRIGQTIPGRPVHVSGENQLTYGPLRRRSNALAAHLVEILPDDGSPIVILGHKECEMLIGFLGAAKSGHPYVPVDSSLPPQRIAKITSTSGAKLTLTPDYISRLPDVEFRPPLRNPKPADPYYIMFTSGSTGDPKGVVITAGCLDFYIRWMLQEQHFVEHEEVILNQAPFSFDLSIGDLYLSLMTGGTLFSITADEIASLKKLFQRLPGSNLSVWSSTPSFARLCLAERRFNAEMLPRIRRFLLLGETLSPEVAKELLDRFPQAEVWNTYGPTEATVAMTSVRINRDLLARYPELPIGYPMPGIQVQITDKDGKVLPPDVKGEIVIAGPNVSPGYLGRPDLTAKAFFNLDGHRAYRTGDLGHYHDGLLFFDGRMDNQIKIHGNRIEIGDIEANMRTLPEVRDAVVIPEGKDGIYNSLTAYVILAERPAGSDFEIGCALRERLAERLPAYMLPRRFYLRESFPMTTNGKVDRRSLQEMA